MSIDRTADGIETGLSPELDTNVTFKNHIVSLIESNTHRHTAQHLDAALFLTKEILDSPQNDANNPLDFKEVFMSIFTDTQEDPPAVRHLNDALVMLVEQKEGQQEIHQHLKDLAMVDELTQIPNRRFLVEQLKIEFSQAYRYKTPLSLAIIDMDGLKKINDDYGHLIGDEAIKNVAQTIINKTRDADICARWGGDEFLIVLPETTKEEAFSVEKKLAEALENASILLKGDASLKTTATIGMVQFNQDEHQTPDMLIAAADKTLYELKEKKVRARKNN